MNRSHRKGRLHPRVQCVRAVVAEVCGLNPYEKKMLEMIKTGLPAKEKRATKMARAKLGQLRRAQAKRDQMIAFRAEEERRTAEAAAAKKAAAKKEKK